MNGLSNKTVEKLRDKAYRDAYVESHVKIGIPYQIRALREQKDRNWSQAELGRRAHKPANVISRLEDPEYGRHTIRTLLEIGAAFDVALLVKYVPYSRFIREFENVSPQALAVPDFTSDLGLMGEAQPTSVNIRTNVDNAQVEEKVPDFLRLLMSTWMGQLGLPLVTTGIGLGVAGVPEEIVIPRSTYDQTIYIRSNP